MLAKLIPGLVGLVLGVCLVLWFQLGTKPELNDDVFRPRRPGDDYKDAPPQTGAGMVASQVDTWPLKLVKGEGKVTELPGYWPHFRGLKRDAMIPETSFELLEDWSKAAPPVLWSKDVGEGHAGVAIQKGRAYLLDYNSKDRRDVLRCISLADGKNIWSSSYPVKIKRSHGISRTVPSLTDKYVVGIGPKCHVTCLDVETGELKWKIDLVGQYGTKVPTWYTGQCPLIMGDQVILAPSGPKCMMMAVAIDTGKVLWTAPNPNEWKMTHTCITPMTLGDKSFYLYSASGGVTAVAADDGKILFDIPEWKIKIAAVASPVLIGDGRVFLSGGYGIGSMMIKVNNEGGKITSKILYRLDPKIFGSAQHTPLLYKGYLYGVRPDQQLICLSLEGKVVWTSSSTHKFGIGPYMLIKDRIFVMNDSGLLSVVAATPKKFSLITQKKVLQGHDSWGPMALAGDRLILRDLTRMICLEISKK